MSAINPQLGACAVVTRLLGALGHVLRPEVNLVIGERQLDLAVQEAAVRLSGEQLPEARVVFQRGSFDGGALLSRAPAGDWDALTQDLERLAQIFEAVHDEPRYTATLAVVRGNECSKLHVDHVKLRLICTYTGPGTEWLPNESVDRAAMGHPHEDVARANACIQRGELQRARPGEVLLLKGEAWPGNTGRGAVHRSPPIFGSGVSRVVFKLTTGVLV